MLDHKEIETLVAIVDGQSFDNAAQQLNVSPGAISQRIKSLENRIGSSVLIRSTPPKPTDVGEQVLTFARRMLLLQNEMDLVLSNKSNDSARALTIAVNHDTLTCWFMDVIQQLDDQPHLAFDIRVSDTLNTQELLIKGDVIAAITSKNNQIGGCKTRFLGQLEYIPVCSKAFFTAHLGDNFTSQMLASAPIALFDRNDDLIEQFLSQYNLHSNHSKTHYIPSSSALVEVVKQGIGWTMLPKILIENELDDNELLLLSEKSVLVDLYWNTWEQVSEIIHKVESVVTSVAMKKLVND
ncbi:ArgP/LysG family DNA-binding transcriptional regulator [Vibrio rarus]|uniref:ArgP/LysG family DNA-binding transcriptional regulator n=1 Tax=Vibrio rarus TaxID=413403 RepID=UPI0021C28845|nr:ArgP/LysG family DNA-binding transcriptional regulator [Vibrio rarus]